MKKKLTSISLISAMVILALTACQSNKENEQTTTGTTVETVVTTPAPTDTSAAETTAESSSAALSTESILESIRDAYGENYLSNIAIPEEMLADTFKLTADMYDEVSTEMPMIGTHPDRIIIVKAKTDKVDMVENALNGAVDDMKNAETMYPMNVAKVNATKVVKNGDYVALICAGSPEERSEPTAEEMASFAEEQTKIGTDAFESCFK